MTDLNKEWEEYFKCKSSSLVFQNYIEVANSKHVQAKILQAQIDVLQIMETQYPSSIYDKIAKKIESLEQQLKELEA